jgi:ASC-1-like (ASCH) protein
MNAIFLKPGDRIIETKTRLYARVERIRADGCIEVLMPNQFTVVTLDPKAINEMVSAGTHRLQAWS